MYRQYIEKEGGLNELNRKFQALCALGNCLQNSHIKCMNVLVGKLHEKDIEWTYRRGTQMQCTASGVPLPTSESET